MTANRALFYALAFGQPKPAHRLVLENWASLASLADFVLVTDQRSSWSDISTAYKNIEIHEITVADFFRRSFPFLNVQSDKEFDDRYLSHFFGTRNGWTACGLRPLMRLMLPSGNYQYWGWIDYDTLCDSAALEATLQTGREMLFFPASGIMWEQIKLFSTDIDITRTYHELFDGAESSPMEARLVYELNRTNAFTRDNYPQDHIAAHWAYSDKIPNLPNHIDVVQNSSSEFATVAGRKVGVFLADTEVKRMNELEVGGVETALKSGTPHRYIHERILS